MDPSSKHSLAAFLENHLPPPNFNFVFWNMGLGDRVERDNVYKTPSELGTEWMPGTRCHGYCHGSCCFLPSVADDFLVWEARFAGSLSLARR